MMSEDLQVTLFGIWLIGFVIYLIFMGMTWDEMADYDRVGKKRVARLIFASPVWPVVLLAFLGLMLYDVIQTLWKAADFFGRADLSERTPSERY
jgi:succinate dehydrogenase hydrophobic anchor subunit